MLRIDLKKAVEEIKKRSAKIVLLQLPEGLKTRNLEIASELQKKTSALVVSTLDPCFGACDLAENAAKQVGADLILHFGHSQFYSPEVPTIFVPLGYELENKKLKELASRAAELLKKSGIKKISLCSTIQYLDFFGLLKKEFEKKGIAIEIPAGKNASPGQVLGCNYSAVSRQADAVVFFGDGLFHPLGIAFSSKKRVFIINPLEAEAKELAGEKELFLKKRFALIEKAMPAQKIGILLSGKKGQFKMQKALELKELIEKHRRQAFLFTADLIRPDYSLGIEVDAFVCTACPRLAIDDASSFRKPLLNPSELEIALGEKTFEEYEIGEFF
ncbi:MAG: diphthamide biosynthesis enzyme Dph2 [Candidatus ainarchaeum sp.]|nr:diphthamide biosynthesis enzyme Dph2 [Candidatus ainarchaeum sp.]